MIVYRSAYAYPQITQLTSNIQDSPISLFAFLSTRQRPCRIANIAPISSLNALATESEDERVVYDFAALCERVCAWRVNNEIRAVCTTCQLNSSTTREVYTLGSYQC